MAEPVVVTIPHKLTKEEAVRRLKKGFGDVRSNLGEKFMRSGSVGPSPNTVWVAFL